MRAFVAASLLAFLIAGLPIERAAVAATGDPKRGEEVYHRCLACHSLEHNRVGPRQCGLFGRKAGSLKDYSYSKAMKNYGVIWNKKTLDHFLENPMKAVPGTKMGYAGVKDPQERADLIAYLKQATPNPAICE
ncbi:cytochrome c family protein [Enhydrobacter sp.]|jgi:cytochrome c|uniref:c-type cytochrome n=1 Tax=Enhydrobacter sp. TaxID=1894999 RepID=UPI0026186801|nr:cytochrome c family protein [Enhydrobacter sp.]WIM13004.1 MAG: Cytochrome c2 [Enhydrobacter sp.]